MSGHSWDASGGHLVLGEGSHGWARCAAGCGPGASLTISEITSPPGPGLVASGALDVERGLLRTVRGSGRYLRETSRLEGEQVTVPGEERMNPRLSVEVASIADSLEARALLEVQVVALACERRTAEEARELAGLADRLTSWEDNLAFHCAVAAATHNFVLGMWVRQQAEQAGELHQREHYNDVDELTQMRAEHKAIAAAIAARDSSAAQELVRQHLQRTRRVIFASVQGTSIQAK